MAAIGGILMLIGGVGSLVFWIISIVKAFKANDTLWGVLNIFIAICGLIWLYMNGQKKLGNYWLLCIIAYIVGFVLAMVGAGSMEIPEPAPAG
ncbi:MAG: hypothetical protein HKN23_12560 [Verrucomicrobiales bacterium]|nr:hypothetical protein [Verrucomicrobiales bacterium]